jgi:chromosome segregation ATPase
MASQEAAVVQEKLESQAKEAQDYVGGGHDKGTVVATQVVVPSKVGEKADEEIRFLKNELSKYKAHLKDCEEAFQLANHETEKANEVTREYKHKVEDLEKEKAELQKTVQTAGEKAAQLELQLNEAEDRYKNKVADLEAKLKTDEKSNINLKEEHDRLRVTIRDREAELRRLDEEINKEEERLKRKLVEKNIAVEELSSKAEHFESRAIPAEKKVSQLDSHAKEMSAKAAGMEADLSHYREETEHKGATIAEFQEELRNAVERANRLGAALREQEEKAATAEKKAAAAEVEAEKLRQKSTEEAALAITMAERIDALEKLLEAAKETKKEGVEQRDMAEPQAEEPKPSPGLFSTIAGLKSRVWGAAPESPETVEVEEAVEADNSAAEKLKGETDQSLQTSAQRLADVEEKMQSLRVERDEAVASADSSRVASLETALGEKDEHIANLENQLQDVTMKVEKHQSAIKGREEDLVRKAEKAHQLQEEVVDAEEQNLKDGEEEFAETSTYLA